jgi:phenylacetate-coenzyme A ligase PaaK-like adenylate-forming protein
MNPFFNPFTGLPFLKNYLFEPSRLKRYDHKKMKKYRDKAFRKIVRYAYDVPLYHKKYKLAGIKPEDIKCIGDIVKLPYITKKDLVENFPDGIIPIDYNKNAGNVASTSGSSGKPVYIYVDFPTMSRGLMLSVRQGIYYNYNLRKVKIASLGTYFQGRIDQVYDDAILSKTQVFRRSNNFLSMNAFEPIKDIVKKLDDFKPDILLAYPVTLQHISYFKKKGYCDNLKPKLLQVGGYSIDEYTRNYIEDAFGCKVVNLYQSVESCGDIATECLKGTWHINYDFYNVEVIDENMKIVSSGEKGHMVLTRLFGRGTPIIRYTGMDDWVTLVPEFDCSCGLSTPILKNGVEGRISARVILPDGRVYPAASFELVSLVLNDLKTFKVTQFQTIQNKIDEIEIHLVIDNDIRDVGPSVDFIFNKVKEIYNKKCGPNVKIIVKEVKEIESPKNKPSPLVISKVKLEDGFKILESK